MSHTHASDLEFVYALRNTVERYFAAVDAWESRYTRFYRMPGASRVSDDLAAEQGVFEERRRELAELLPRARALCFKSNQPDVFAGLLHIALGEFGPQHRTGSAISSGERGAVMACLIELNVACRAAEAGLPSEVRKRSLLDRIFGFLG